MNLTREQLLERFPNASPGFLRANAGGGLPAPVPAKIEPPGPVSVPKKRLRQDSRPLENKLEMAYRELLEARYPTVKIRPQAKRYRLGNGIWFKPDLTALIDGVEHAWEVKGPHAFRGGFENLKVAAASYPEVRWTLAWRIAKEWNEQVVLP